MGYSRVPISCRALAPIVRCVDPGFAVSTARRILDSSHLMTPGTRSSGSYLVRGRVVSPIYSRHGFKRRGWMGKNKSEPIFLELCLVYVRQHNFLR